MIAAFLLTLTVRAGDVDPWAAYADGRYEEAMTAFVERLVEDPLNPGLLLNAGSAQYGSGDYEAAARSFAQAAGLGDDTLRARASYAQGNTAYRQGALDEAVAHYQRTLDTDPEHADAKYNLEFVRDEIRRRHEESQKRQQEQQDQQQDQQQGDQDQQQGDQDQQQGDQDQQQDEQGQPGEQSEQQDEQGQQSEQDSDGDGLSDAQEQQAENPTDPANPDTDGDGLSDGQEDRDGDGRVGPGETDPNQIDSDGDGQPDGGVAQAPGRQLTAEEADRLLQSLDETRPQSRRGRRTTNGKDW